MIDFPQISKFCLFTVKFPCYNADIKIKTSISISGWSHGWRHISRSKLKAQQPARYVTLAAFAKCLLHSCLARW